MTTVAVVAKECRPGRVKTRLCPPYLPDEAARIAQACVDDTLAAVASAAPAGHRRLLYFDGATPPASADGFEVVPQVEGPFDERLAHLLDVCDGPTFFIGMDTPQVDPVMLRRLCGRWPSDVDAWFGPAEDGGFWLLGLREPTGALLRGVEMSLASTGAEVLRRLAGAGLAVATLPTLLDIDLAGDAEQVARSLPHSRLALTLAAVARSRRAADVVAPAVTAHRPGPVPVAGAVTA